MLFNGATAVLYWLLLALLGMEQLVAEFSAMGAGMLLVCLALGNVTFFLLDRLLSRDIRRR